VTLREPEKILPNQKGEEKEEHKEKERLLGKR
jgi:hypothetical protein